MTPDPMILVKEFTDDLGDFGVGGLVVLRFFVFGSSSSDSSEWYLRAWVRFVRSSMLPGSVLEFLVDRIGTLRVEFREGRG